MSEITVRHEPERSRFVLELDGAVVGVAAYRRDGEDWVFDHTVVEPEHSGKGLAGRLVRFALDEVVAAGGTIVPVCSYVAGYLDRHPEYAEHVQA